MSLITEIDAKRREIRTDGYAMSIGEWLSLYNNDEIDIHPEFQRFYRWSNQQKTDFIESIILGIPIPQIFVSQRSDGKWDVIDGLQRLSTIYELMGVLQDENGELIPSLVLESAEYLPDLKGYNWDGVGGNIELPNEVKLYVKRAKLNVSIVEKESDQNAKYDLFQRLNTGGSSLTAQEVRNCVLVMVNIDFYKWIEGLSNNDYFSKAILISDRQKKESYDLELLLRFLCFSTADSVASFGDVGVYLDQKSREMASNKSFDYSQSESLFSDVFEILYKNLEDDVFKKYDTNREKFVGGFSLTAFETITSGIAYNLRNGSLADDISSRVTQMWGEPEFREWTRGGTTAARRIPKLLPLGRRLFSNAV